MNPLSASIKCSKTESGKIPFDSLGANSFAISGNGVQSLLLLYATGSKKFAPSATDSSDHVPVENEHDELMDRLGL